MREGERAFGSGDFTALVCKGSVLCGGHVGLRGAERRGMAVPGHVLVTSIIFFT
jgi:hypothetical protein